MVAVICAGGKGTRLKTITGEETPKPMVPVLSKPLLERQIISLKGCGITNIVLLVGFKSDYIKDYFGNGSRFGVNISYVIEDSPLGTGGALFYLKNTIKEDFFFIFGDLLLDIDWNSFYQYHLKHKKKITLFSHPNSHPFDSDLLLLDQNNIVTGINSKHNDRTGFWFHNLTNAGIYVLSPKIFDMFHKLCKIDFEKDIVQKLIKDKQVLAYVSSEYVKDIGTPSRYEQAEYDIKQGTVENKKITNPQKAIFLDRDGVINVYKGLLTDINEFELYDDAGSAIKMINNSGYLAIVITNQPVVARGDVTIEQLDTIHKKMETLLGAHGAYLDAVYFCPHHPDSGFKGEVKELKIDCECRKPKPGLFLKAQKEFNIDLDKSYMIGDTYQDMMVSLNARVKGILLECGSKEKLMDKYTCNPFKVCSTLKEAVSFILNKEGNNYGF